MSMVTGAYAVLQSTVDCKQDIILCYSGDVYAADLIYDVSGNGDVTAVELEIDGCYYDWNYVRGEARLYISLASANALPKTVSLASVTVDGELTLTPASAIVNGTEREGVYSEHSEVDLPAVPPSHNQEGLSAGKKCSVCGVILQEQSITPPIIKVVAKASIFSANDSGDTRMHFSNGMEEHVIISENGDYVIDDLPHGEYTVTFKKLGHLSHKVTGVLFTGSDLEFGRIDLIAGDINGDGYIDAVDVSSLVSVLLTVPKQDDPSDFNKDNFIDALDVSILSSNMFKKPLEFQYGK